MKALIQGTIRYNSLKINMNYNNIVMIKNNNIGRLNIAIIGYKASRLMFKRNTIKIGNVIKKILKHK